MAKDVIGDTTNDICMGGFTALCCQTSLPAPADCIYTGGFFNCAMHHPELTVMKIAVILRIPAAHLTSPISKPLCPALAVCAQMVNTLVSAARTLFHMRTVNGKVYLQRVQMASKQLFATLAKSQSVSRWCEKPF